MINKLCAYFYTHAMTDNCYKKLIRKKVNHSVCALSKFLIFGIVLMHTSLVILIFIEIKRKVTILAK